MIFTYSNLNNKWKEKSQLIGQLEKQVQQMKDNWENKEKKLTQERNKAVEAARYVGIWKHCRFYSLVQLQGETQRLIVIFLIQ